MKKTDKVTWNGHTLTVEEVMEAQRCCSIIEIVSCIRCPLHFLNRDDIDCGYSLPGFAFEALKLAVED